MSTTGPPRCSNHIGTPDLPWTNYCALPIYQLLNATKEPLETLRECCPSPDENIGLFGEDQCVAYCNASSQETRAELQWCLHVAHLREFGCSGASAGAAGGIAGWGVYLVVGLVGLIVFGS